MAEVDTGGGGGAKGRHAGGPKQKKKSTKIDMTAMVDVAFLLLTFFILTTTMATPQAMEINKPPKTDDESNQQEVREEKVMTVVLGADDKIYYWVGATDVKIKDTDFSDEGVRTVIQEHLNRHPNLCSSNNNAPGCWDPIFVLKPNKSSRFKNMVDILDEMRINEVKKYALAEVTPEDSTLLADNNLK